MAGLGGRWDLATDCTVTVPVNIAKRRTELSGSAAPSPKARGCLPYPHPGVKATPRKIVARRYAATIFG